MAESIEKIRAEQVLLTALRQNCSKQDDIAMAIQKILAGSHKTYKYVLVNALLAKATNPKINPLALQAGAPFEGAYDARSLCHQVLVPFERDFLQNALGGSNEPFLNKPARFTHLSAENAVRKGQDKEVLNLLIFTLTKITTSGYAKSYLSCALNYLQKRIEGVQILHESKIKYSQNLVDLYMFIHHFLEKSHGGTTSAIVVGTLEKIYYLHQKGDFNVVAHKVNQSGASSKEVGDIDVFKDGQFYCATEVKDKHFTVHDLAHAFEKIIENGGKKGQFVYGPKASFDKKSIQTKLAELENKGFMPLFVDIYEFARFILVKTDSLSRQAFIDHLMQTAIEMNVKDSVHHWIQHILQELTWK